MGCRDKDLQKHLGLGELAGEGTGGASHMSRRAVGDRDREEPRFHGPSPTLTSQMHTPGACGEP